MIVKKEDMQKTEIAKVFREYLTGLVYWAGDSRQRISNATADELFAEYRDRNVKGEFCKGIRPWDLVDFSANHPDADVLVGVEVEVGFSSQKKLTNAYKFLMDECEYATADTEGYGDYPLEATFPPVPADQLLSDNCQLTRYYTEVLSKQKEIWPAGSMTGTHFNLSYKGISDVNYNELCNKASVLTSTVQENDGHDSGYCCEDCDGDYDDWLADRGEERGSSSLTDSTVLYKLFGRRPYGGAYVRSKYKNGRDVPGWIELKLFNSTTNLEKLRWYKEVSLAICDWFRSGKKDELGQMFEKLAARSPLDANGNLLPQVSAAVPAPKPVTKTRKKEKSIAVAR